MNTNSTFLFAMPSAIEGVGRLLDFGNTLTEYNDSGAPDEADAVALAMDWAIVGNDIQSANIQLADQLEQER